MERADYEPWRWPHSCVCLVAEVSTLSKSVRYRHAGNPQRRTLRRAEPRDILRARILGKDVPICTIQDKSGRED